MSLIGRVFRLIARVLRGTLRVIAWTLLILVLVSAGLVAYVYRRFSPNDVRLLAAEQLTALLHREVTIERLVLSPRGLKIVGLRVRRGRGEGAGDLLSCGSALATVKLRPLLDRRLEFNKIILQAPQISLSRDEDGRWNLNDIFGSTASALSGPPAFLPAALAAAETVVKDGELRVDDRLRGRALVFQKLSLGVQGFCLDKPFPVETSFGTTGVFRGRAVAASVEASGKVDLAGLSWSSAAMTADRLSVEIGGVVMRGKLSARGFPATRIEAEASTPPLGPGQWRSLFGRDWDAAVPSALWSLKAGLPAPGMVDVESLSVRTPAGEASATGLFDFGADTPTLSVELLARGADLPEVASWSSALAVYGLKGKADARASITGWPGRLKVREADVSLRGFGGSWKERSVAGADIDASASEDFARLKVAVANGRIAAVGNVFDDVFGTLIAENGSLEIERLALRWGGSRVKLRAKVAMEREQDRSTRLKSIVLSGGVDKVDWEAAARLVSDVRAAISTRTAAAAEIPASHRWLSAFKYMIPRGFPDTTGHIRVGEVAHPNFHCKDVDLMWSLRGVTPALDKVGGEARLSFGPGRVNDVPAVQDANKFLRVIFLPFVFMHKMNKLAVFSAATAYPKSFDFAKIDGEYGASKGVVTTRYFHVDSPQFAAYASGTADFGRERVDMDILTRLADYQGTLPEWWVDERGRPAIGFRVAGDINKPDLQPRFKKISEGEIESDVETGRARAKKRFEALEKLQTF